MQGCPPNFTIGSTSARTVRLKTSDRLPLPVVLCSLRHLVPGEWVVNELVIDAVNAEKMVRVNRLTASPLPPRIRSIAVILLHLLMIMFLAVRLFVVWHNHVIMDSGGIDASI